MRALLPYLALLPTIFLLVFGWVGFRVGGQVSRAHGPDTRMLYPIQQRRSLLQRLAQQEPAAMSARAVRRLGLCAMLASPLPIGFLAGWQVFSPAYWARQFHSPCAELIPVALVQKRARGDVDIHVTDNDDSCWARFKDDKQTLMRVHIQRARSALGFDFHDAQADKHGKQIDQMSEFSGDTRVYRWDDWRTTLMLRSRGWALEVELSRAMRRPAAEQEVRRAIQKNKRRMRLDKR